MSPEQHAVVQKYFTENRTVPVRLTLLQLWESAGCPIERTEQDEVYKKTYTWINNLKTALRKQSGSFALGTLKQATAQQRSAGDGDLETAAGPSPDSSSPHDPAEPASHAFAVKRPEWMTLEQHAVVENYFIEEQLTNEAGIAEALGKRWVSHRTHRAR
jgi:hypothetical protein